MTVQERARSIESELGRIVRFEQGIKRIQVEDKVRVSFLDNGKTIKINVDSLELYAQANRQIIHQIGARIWRDSDLPRIEELWKSYYSADPVLLAQEVVTALQNTGHEIRYSEESAGNRIYGIMSPQFVDSDQLQFRKSVVTPLKSIGFRPSNIVSRTPYGEVVEKFEGPLKSDQVGLSCNIIYGLNTGYSSYRVLWGRSILVCSNGLTIWEPANRSRWLHTGTESVPDFITTSVQSALEHLSKLERSIGEAQSRELDSDNLRHLVHRMAMANATKNRFMSRLSVEIEDTGPNEWSVSQAMTYLGQHEKAIPFRTRDDLTRLGSNILESSLSSVATAPAKVASSGFYDILR